MGHKCDDSLATVSRSVSLFLWSLGVLAHLFSLVLVIKIFKHYHLFFILFYLIMILTRIMSAVIKVLGYAIILFAGRGVVMHTVDDLLWVSKFATQSAALACVVERGYATFNAKVYENSMKRSFLFICSLVCIISVVLAYFNNERNDATRKITAVTYGVVLALLTILMIVINRRLVTKSLGNYSLTQRYQLTENVKALR